MRSILFAGALALWSLPAMAADVYDAWINVFAFKSLVVEKVEVIGQSLANGRRLEEQQISAVLRPQTDILFYVVRRAGEDAGRGFARTAIDTLTASKENLASYLGVAPDEISDLQPLEGRDGRGATFVIRSCLFACEELVSQPWIAFDTSCAA